MVEPLYGEAEDTADRRHGCGDRGCRCRSDDADQTEVCAAQGMRDGSGGLGGQGTSRRGRDEVYSFG